MFSIISNDSNSITTDLADGSLLDYGTPGAPYQGAILLDNLVVRGAGFLDTNGNLVIIGSGGVHIDGGTLESSGIVEW